LADKIAAARDVDALARLVIEHLCASHQCDAALLLTQSDSDGAICWAGFFSTSPQLSIPGLPARLSENQLASRAIGTAKTVFVVESANEHTMIAVPLKTRGAPFGALQLSGASLGVSDPGEIAHLEALADLIAAAIASLRGEQERQSPMRANNIVSARFNLQRVYHSIYQGVARLMPCDAFFIALCDEESGTGNFVFRIENGVALPVQQFPLAEGMVNYVIRTRQGIVVSEVAEETRFKIQRWGGEKQVRSLVCVPMDYGGRVVGVVSAQSYQPATFSDADRVVLCAFADQAAMTIHSARLFEESQRKERQLNALNQVTRIVSSTIEINRLLDLIYTQVRRILTADTYYVALLDESEQNLNVAVLVDDGEQFPPTQIPLGDNLASFVVRQRTPLLLKSVAEEAPALGVSPYRMGKPKPSESWLGVPVMTFEHIIGVLAVASYQRDAFDESDKEILQSVAAQAAIAIDNARHHAEVEEQARRDSLTQVFNHGYFVQRLQEEIERAKGAPTPLALIMLDIDHFKEYNDQHGHLAGDAILRGTVQAIRRHVKQSDIVGRWGGEEFAIALLKADRQGARRVAERVRKTLAEMRMQDDRGRAVPAPTVSQGIATFPEDADEAFALVDVADRRLYQAKARGRDQIGE
jgi:diguanylate cyclase (GGDEF)-like protein